MLADEFLKIGKLNVEDRTPAFIKLYKTNNRFKQYADMCYLMDAAISTEGLPDIKYDIGPLGHHPTKLEMIVTDFKVIAYGTLEAKRAMQRLLQIFESISRVEVDFLKQVIDGGIIGFPFQEWEQLYKKKVV